MHHSFHFFRFFNIHETSIFENSNFLTWSIFCWALPADTHFLLLIVTYKFCFFFYPTNFQVKTWYDEERLDLVVTVLSAADLPPRVNGQYRNPYAKVFLLPDRRWLSNMWIITHRTLTYIVRGSVSVPLTSCLTDSDSAPLLVLN